MRTWHIGKEAQPVPEEREHRGPTYTTAPHAMPHRPEYAQVARDGQSVTGTQPYREDPVYTPMRREPPVAHESYGNVQPASMYRPTAQTSGIHPWPGGVDEPGLTVIIPNIAQYRELVDYRTYRLMDQSTTFDSSAAKRISKVYRRMQAADRTLKFNGKVPLKILEFLWKFKFACDSNGVHEGMAVWLFQYFLDGSVHTAVTSRLSANIHGYHRRNEADALRTFPAVVNFLLRQYATDDVISEAHLDLTTFRQSSGMLEEDFSELLMKKNRLCGNVLDDLALKASFIEGLLPAIRSAVRSHSHDFPSKTYSQIVRFAASQGDAQRGGRVIKPTREAAILHKKRVKKGAVMFADGQPASTSSSDTTSESSTSDAADAEVLAITTATRSPTAPSLPTSTTAPSSKLSPGLTRPSGYGQGYPSPRKPFADVPGVRCLLCHRTDRPCCVNFFPNPAVRTALLKQREANFHKFRADSPRRPSQQPSAVSAPPVALPPAPPVYAPLQYGQIVPIPYNPSVQQPGPQVFATTQSANLSASAVPTTTPPDPSGKAPKST